MSKHISRQSRESWQEWAARRGSQRGGRPFADPRRRSIKEAERHAFRQLASGEGPLVAAALAAAALKPRHARPLPPLTLTSLREASASHLAVWLFSAPEDVHFLQECGAACEVVNDLLLDGKVTRAESVIASRIKVIRALRSPIVERLDEHPSTAGVATRAVVVYLRSEAKLAEVGVRELRDRLRAAAEGACAAALSQLDAASRAAVWRAAKLPLSTVAARRTVAAIDSLPRGCRGHLRHVRRHLVADC